MKKVLLSAVLIFSCFNYCVSQRNVSQSKDTRSIVFWNVENLFDTFNDPNTNDDEYLTTGSKQWNEEKYRKKIGDISKVIASVNENELPSIIGLAEVENKKVLEDIAASQKLRKGKYGIIHYESKDPNGLDVALLYRKDEIDIIDSKAIPIVSAFDTQNVSRDILYVRCKIKGDTIFHFFINHWPSRIPDEQVSEIKRITAAITLRKEVDNILNFDNRAHIIIMGDFNDEPTNKSLLQILNASNKRKNVDYRDLYNLMYDIHNAGNEGSFSENNRWRMFDQIIVSPELLVRESGYYLSNDDGTVFRNEDVLVTDPQTKLSYPNPTYNGSRYIGGPSNHLPVYIILKKEEK
jgi:endonuclease/exonuclease/phosphatase family metal-dependent hydrolase